MYALVLWDQWGDNIIPVSHIYIDPIYWTKGKLSCHLNKGRIITFYCGPLLKRKRLQTRDDGLPLQENSTLASSRFASLLS